MKFYHVPGLSVARIADFRVAETGRIGVANVETGESVSDDTLFQAGSLGSPLVNIAALRLAADGRLDLSRPANAYLKEWRIPENDFTRARSITVADLICGTSGLSQYKFVGYRPDAAVPTLLALFQGTDPEEMQAVIPVAVPGGKFQSLGINQTILQRVLTDATGKAFPALMEELVFAPLGMTRSCYDPVPTANPAFRVAVGHYSTGEMLLDKFHIYPEAAASGLWTTAPDFAKALCEVQKLLDNRPNALLPPEKRGLLSAVSNAESVLGFLRDGKGFLYHGGNPYGYFANHRISEQKGVGIVVMQNRILSWRLHNEIVEAAAQQYGWKGEGGHE
jgi:CubicO group peptidase (beta-lactamase class C family)